MSSPSDQQFKPGSSAFAAGADDNGSGSRGSSRQRGREDEDASSTKAEAQAVEDDLTLQPRPSNPMTSPTSHEVSRSTPSPASPHQGPAYPETTSEALLPPADFKPFFTLIEDPETGEHHHPTVHYIFADDEPEFLTDATLTAIEQAGEEDSEEKEKEKKKEERFVLVDIAADGKTVVSATSLCARWQALKAGVGQAPSLGQSEEGGGNPMLKISGQELPVVSRQGGKMVKMSMEELVRSFGDRLATLDEVVGKELEEGAAAVTQDPSVQESRA